MQTRHHLCKAGGNGIRSWLAIGPCVLRFPWLTILGIERQLSERVWCHPSSSSPSTGSGLMIGSECEWIATRLGCFQCSTACSSLG